MTIRKMFLGFLSLWLVTGSPGFPEEKILESQKLTQPVQIDGYMEEWSQAELYLEKNSKVRCAFQNDSENLYVLMIFEEPKSLSSINETGITLSFNTEGKKKKTTGVHFIQKMLAPEEAIAELEKQGEVLSEEQKRLIRTKAGAIVYLAESVQVKDQLASEATWPADILRPAFWSRQEDGKFVYEFRIPLARPEAHFPGLGASPGQTILINFEWGGLTEEMRKAMRARERTNLGRDIAGESGAGTVIVPGREGGGAPGGGPMPSPKKYSFWVGVKLASAEG